MLLVLLGVLVSGDRSGAARAADAISLDLPIRCELGRDCWIVNYVDMDPSAATHDYNCGGATYDGHEGTDFAIRDLRAMDEGVPVLAAAPGRVKGVRDSMDDAGVSTIGEKEALEGRLCGNRVAIVHGGGWVTNYCHLRRGSIVVADGEAVKAGQVLAMVGQSGFAAFPHLHLGVIKGKRDIDPFVGLAREDRCGLGTRPLWKPRLLERLQYRPTALFNAGFATTKPKWDAVKRGAYRDDVLSRKARVLGVMGGDLPRQDGGPIDAPHHRSGRGGGVEPRQPAAEGPGQPLRLCRPQAEGALLGRGHLHGRGSPDP